MSEHLVAFFDLFAGSGELWIGVAGVGVGIVGAAIGAAQLALMLAQHRRREIPFDIRPGHGLDEPKQRGVKRRRRRARGRRR